MPFLNLLNQSVFLSNSKEPIDFVLAYQPNECKEDEMEIHKGNRKAFEDQLVKQGLKLEFEKIEASQDGKTCFVKISAPFDVLARTAEINRIKMPIEKLDASVELGHSHSKVADIVGKPFQLPHDYRLPEPEYYTAPFTRARQHQFLLGDKKNFFSQVQRIRMVWDIIQRINIHNCEDKEKEKEAKGHSHGEHGVAEKVGISYLLKEEVYTAAFPIHDGDHKPKDEKEENKPVEQWPLRRYLYETWGRFGRWRFYQPLDQIRAYFGAKVAIYFAWLGFYTQMLIVPAIIGLICFCIGIGSLFTKDPRLDICAEEVKNVTMCRLCPKEVCPYQKLSKSCLSARVTVVFDNWSTPFFAFFISIWAVIFLELWKRKQAELAWRWDVRDVRDADDEVRPEYLTHVKSVRVNPVTLEDEPHLPTSKRAARMSLSVLVVTGMIGAVLGVMAGIIFLKIALPGWLYGWNENIKAKLATAIIAGILNTICILILSKVYDKVAMVLTAKELPRTETNFESSFTYKMFIFQFMNFYGSLFYIAFLKGKLAHPHSVGYIDRCDPSGCMYNVCFQLGIIMVVKQIIGNIKEIAIPAVKNCIKRRKDKEDNEYNRWEKDHDLGELARLGMFNEYLEMIIQYGFVTMFVAAFPLAPLFALINNIFEIRIDGNKLVTQVRRPIPARAKDIGAWYKILEVITKIAVVTNGLLIAFTSDFVDRIMYLAERDSGHNAATGAKHDNSNVTVDLAGCGGNLTDFLLKVFYKFNTTSYLKDPMELAGGVKGNESCCYQRGYYEDYSFLSADCDHQNEKPWPAQYGKTHEYWYSLVLRLGFFICFLSCVVFCQFIIQYIIPDVPEHIRNRIEREEYLAREARLKHAIDGDMKMSVDPQLRKRASGPSLKTGGGTPRSVKSKSKTTVQSASNSSSNKNLYEKM